MTGLARAAASRIAGAVVSAELRRLRDVDLPDVIRSDWPEETPLGEDGLGLDSLEQIGAMGALTETFDLDDTLFGQGPPQTVGDWIDWVMAGQAEGEGRLTVATSGSTGAPRQCIHRMADLIEEAAYLARQFGDRRRVVALVPAHHLYGIVWTALLPSALGVSVQVANLGSPLGLAAGDLIVAVPEQWRALLRMTRRFPADVMGVSSAGPLDDSLAAELLAVGLAQLVDVYGSSETGAIAMRRVPSKAYDLLPRWVLSAVSDDDWQLVDRDGTAMPLPDHVERIGARSLRPVGRRDGAVQVGGHNVWPEHVAQVLRDTAGVAEAAVRLHANGRLKAFIVPEQGQDPAALSADLERATVVLADYAIPKSFRYGTALPRNAMGKLSDWA